MDLQKVLITGANGFVGREIVDALAETGRYEIGGLIGKNRELKTAQKHKTPKILSVDIADYKTLRAAEKEFENSATVIHCAGLAHQFGKVTKEDFWSVNVEGTENICRLAAATGAKHIVLISSVAVYGDYGNVEIDETYECRPASFYAESKLEAERRAIDFCKAHSMKLTILRPATIIGEGDRGNTARLIKLIDRKRFAWIGNGDNKKSLIYKKDVARGIVSTLEFQKCGKIEIYNLCTEPVTMKEIVSVIAENLRVKAPRLKISEKLVRGIFGVNRLPLKIGYLTKIEKTFDKWLSDDIFSGKKFNDRFNFRAQTGVSVALGLQTGYYLKHLKRKA